jgi:membrane protein YqaA with SNARE-associated domain
MPKHGDHTLSTWYGRLCNHANSKWPLSIGFVWGFAEGTAFFIVPDVYLGFVALLHGKRGLWAMISGIIGAMVGGSLMYSLAMRDVSTVNLFLDRIPLINADMISEIANKMQRGGLITMVNGPLRGIPYKVYAVQAGGQALPYLSFLVFTILARLERLLPVTLLAGVFGKRFKNFVEQHTLFVVVMYALLWGIIYILYYLRFR